MTDYRLCLHFCVPLAIIILSLGHYHIAGMLCSQISYGGFVSIGVTASKTLTNVL